jgi:hypothetical protein
MPRKLTPLYIVIGLSLNDNCLSKIHSYSLYSYIGVLHSANKLCVQVLQGTVVSFPSWDEPTWVTNIDPNIRSLKEVIIIYFNSEMKELASWLLSYLWNSQVVVG